MFNQLIQKPVMAVASILLGLSLVIPVSGLAKTGIPKDMAAIVTPQSGQSLNVDSASIVVQLKASTQPEDFKVWLNGKNVTGKFVYDTGANQMVGVVGLEDGLMVQKTALNGIGKWEGLNVLKTNIMVTPSEADPDVDVRSFFVKSRSLTP